jgi:hypothetical protein
MLRCEIQRDCGRDVEARKVSLVRASRVADGGVWRKVFVPTGRVRLHAKAAGKSGLVRDVDISARIQRDSSRVVECSLRPISDNREWNDIASAIQRVGGNAVAIERILDVAIVIGDEDSGVAGASARRRHHLFSVVGQCGTLTCERTSPTPPVNRTVLIIESIGTNRSRSGGVSNGDCIEQSRSARIWTPQ